MVVYRCPICSWEGTTNQMDSEQHELICPSCQAVFPLVDDFFEECKWDVVSVENGEDEDYGEF